MSVKQVETATVLGTVTDSGSASVIVTAAGMSNSPVTVLVGVVALDSASVVAVKIKNVLALHADVGSFFAVSGTGADVVLTCRLASPNDTTINIAIDNVTCDGLTPAPISTDTTAGVGIENGYATLAEYKQWIAVRGLAGAVGTDVSDDSAIEILIESVSRYIDSQCGRRFFLNSADETRYYSPADYQFYELPIDPLASITTLSIDYQGLRSYTDIDTDDYDLTPDNAALDKQPYTGIRVNPLTDAYFPTFARSVKVAGKFGWPVVPKDITEACLSIVQNLYGSRSGQTSAGSVTITAAGVVIRPQDVPAFAQVIIASYRKLT